MQGIEVCDGCGVPAYISSQHMWHPSGFIVQRLDTRHILIFIEVDNLNTLAKSLQETLGHAVERIMVNTRRRAARAYMERVIPDVLKEQVRSGQLGVAAVVQGMVGIGQVLGYGRFEVADLHMEGGEADRFLIRVEDMYSIALGCADPVAAIEALIGREMGLSYRELGPGKYEIEAFPQPHPQELRGRLTMRKYTYPEGDILMEACGRCGAPLKLKEYDWDLERGTITDRLTGRRMVFFAPSVLEAIFEELEGELGEVIPEMVVDVQKRLVKEGLYGPYGADPHADLREKFALRGLGNLKEFSLEERGLRLYMENACLPLLVVGTARGLYERAWGRESMAEWESPGGDDLRVQVRPA